MRIRSINRLALVSVITVTMLLTACASGPDITLLRTGIAAVQPAVEYAIAKGAITPERAKLYRDDATKLLDGYETLTAGWNAAGSDKAAKLAAVQAFANSTLAPIAGDFTRVPQLAEAMLILNTTVTVLTIYYGGHGAPGVSADGLASEGDVKAYLKAQNEKLKAALAH